MTYNDTFIRACRQQNTEYTPYGTCGRRPV